MQHEIPEEDAIEIEALGVEVSSQPIELYKVLKMANVVNGGGEAKHFIGEGYVAVNGELETRKRRKMYDGDFLEFDGEYYVVVCDSPVEEPAQSTSSVEDGDDFDAPVSHVSLAAPADKQDKHKRSKAAQQKRTSKKSRSASKNGPSNKAQSASSSSAASSSPSDGSQRASTGRKAPGFL